MNPAKIIAALVLLAVFSAFTCVSCFSDDLPNPDNGDSGDSNITQVSFVDDDVPAVSVPEPATFGLISLALAVGGGLLVRRKSD